MSKVEMIKDVAEKVEQIETLVPDAVIDAVEKEPGALVRAFKFIGKIAKEKAPYVAAGAVIYVGVTKGIPAGVKFVKTKLQERKNPKYISAPAAEEEIENEPAEDDFDDCFDTEDIEEQYKVS